MKEIYCDRDFTKVGFFQSILEEHGIATLMRNRDLVTFVTEIPVPLFFPMLCVLNDDDYDRALAILQPLVTGQSDLTSDDWQCSKCGEKIPGNFEICWACQEPQALTGTG
ncbi:MAG: hypothetical protein ACI9R3_002146 [Verrucomicrobiales bacterium]|jgi:hypothetical protein